MSHILANTHAYIGRLYRRYLAGELTPEQYRTLTEPGAEPERQLCAICRHRYADQIDDGILVCAPCGMRAVFRRRRGW